MSKENNIRKGMLSEKMRNFHAEPPADAWDNIASQLPRDGRSRKVFFVVLAAAASLALAITVGVKLIDRSPEPPIAENHVQDQTPVEVRPEGERTDTEIPEVLQEEQGDIKDERTQSSRLEEKVLVAIEEVINEMDADINKQDQVNIAENVLEVQDHIPNDQETDDQDAHSADVQEVVAEDDQDADDQGADDQQEIDQAYSERYLDSISKAVIPDDEIIPSNEKDQKKWQMGASLTPLFSYRDASSTDQAQNMAANNSESGVLAYSGGVQLRYAQSDRLTFESGIYYNKMGLAIGNFDTYRSRMDYMFEDVVFTDNSIVSMSNSIGTISTTSNADVVVNAWAGPEMEGFTSLDSKEMRVQDEVVNSFEQSLEYLEIPFNVKYKIIDKSLKVLLVGGISTNLLIGNQTFANTSNGKLDYGNVQDIKTVNYSGNAGLGFVYEFTGNFSLSLEPRFRYFLNSINLESLPVTRPFTLGLYTGVNYTF